MEAYLFLVTVFFGLVEGQLPTSVYKTDAGPVQGVILDGVQVFHGIPYAAPPVGNLRFRSPQPVQPWNTTLSCIKPPTICPQFSGENHDLFGGEDCLYLDVYVPLKASKTPRPVAFWIYGGGYTIGDGWEFGKYDGKNLTKFHDFIVVTHNYRLGALGFLSLDELRAEDANKSTGNYALQDQVAALQWVKRNIAVFGGDPTQVTIFGESAGAFSVCWHLVSQASKGLFASAIMESGTCDSTFFFVTYERGVSWSQLHIKSHGCDPTAANVLDCIRNMTVPELLWIKKDLYNETGYWLPILYPVMPWGPVVDGSTKGLLDFPLSILQKGTGNNVPLIAGTNNNEGSMFVPGLPAIVPEQISMPMVEQDVTTVLDHFYCDNSSIVNTILPLYPLSDFRDPDHQMGMIVRDWFFVCATRRIHRTLYNYIPKNSWMYHFDYVDHWPGYPYLGDYHSSELNFVFDNWWPHDLKPWNATDQKVADTFGIYWSNMVWNHNTNGPKEAVPLTWPYWDPQNEQGLMITVPVSVESHYVSDKCNMWDQVRTMCEYCGC